MLEWGESSWNPPHFVGPRERVPTPLPQASGRSKAPQVLHAAPVLGHTFVNCIFLAIDIVQRTSKIGFETPPSTFSASTAVCKLVFRNVWMSLCLVRLGGNRVLWHFFLRDCIVGSCKIIFLVLPHHHVLNLHLKSCA